MSRRNLKGRGDSARSTEVSTIPRQVDLRVHDDVAMGEIELYAEVLTAVAASDGPLSPRELDAVLGVGPVCNCSLRSLRTHDPTGCRYMTSVLHRSNPSDVYILTAGVFDSST